MRNENPYVIFTSDKDLRRTYLRMIGRARRQRYILQCEVLWISGLVFYEHVCCTGDIFREEINFAQTSRIRGWTIERDVRFYSDSYIRFIYIRL